MLYKHLFGDYNTYTYVLTTGDNILIRHEMWTLIGHLKPRRGETTVGNRCLYRESGSSITRWIILISQFIYVFCKFHEEKSKITTLKCLVLHIVKIILVAALYRVKPAIAVPFFFLWHVSDFAYPKYKNLHHPHFQPLVCIKSVW